MIDPVIKVQEEDFNVGEELAQFFVVSHCEHDVARVDGLSFVVTTSIAC